MFLCYTWLAEFTGPAGSVEDRPLVGFVLGGAKKEEEIWAVPVVSMCRLVPPCASRILLEISH